MLPAESINAATMLRTAVEFVDVVRRVRHPRSSAPVFTRIGLHTGDVVGGVIGTRSFRYDIWGADVLPGLSLVFAGKVSVKGRGKLATYFVRLEGIPLVCEREHSEGHGDGGGHGDAPSAGGSVILGGQH